MKQIADNLARRLALFLYLLERPGGARTNDILRDLPRHYTTDGVDVESAKRYVRRDIEKLARDGFYIVSDVKARAAGAAGAANAGAADAGDADGLASVAGATGAADSAGANGEGGASGVATAEGRYKVDARRTFAAPVSFTDDEAAFLRVACVSLLQDASYPRTTELLGALAHLSDELDAPDTLLPLMHGAPPASSLPTSIAKVRHALETGSSLLFSYTDARGASTCREVAPLRVFTFDRHLYLVGCDVDGDAGGGVSGAGGDADAADGEEACAEAGGAEKIGEEGGADRLRVFRLDRMSHVKGGDALPPGALDVRGADMWPCLPFQFSARRFAAKVLFSPAAYAQASALTMQRGFFTRIDGASEDASHEDAALGGAGAVWEIEASDARALAAWCVENGPGLQPLEPPEAVQAFSEILDGAEGVCHAI